MFDDQTIAEYALNTETPGIFSPEVPSFAKFRVSLKLAKTGVGSLCCFIKY